MQGTLEYSNRIVHPWHSRGLRMMPVDNYSVFYIPDVSKGILTFTIHLRQIYCERCFFGELVTGINSDKQTSIALPNNQKSLPKINSKRPAVCVSGGGGFIIKKTVLYKST